MTSLKRVNLFGGVITMLIFKGCGKCKGDVAQIDGDWKCVQCGREYVVETNSQAADRLVKEIAGFLATQRST